MKIKTVKKMRLDELLKHVWHEGGEHKTYMSNEGKSVDIDDSGIQFLNDYKINSGIVLSRETFTVEVEEELTEDTEFDSLWELYYDTIDKKPGTYVNFHTSVSKILDENSIDGDNITLAIYYGSTLIWTKDTGIPADGVLEVSEE